MDNLITIPFNNIMLCIPIDENIGYLKIKNGEIFEKNIDFSTKNGIIFVTLPKEFGDLHFNLVVDNENVVEAIIFTTNHIIKSIPLNYDKTPFHVMCCILSYITELI